MGYRYYFPVMAAFHKVGAKILGQFSHGSFAYNVLQLPTTAFAEIALYTAVSVENFVAIGQEPIDN